VLPKRIKKKKWFDWSSDTTVGNPACQCCFYKPLRNCHPSQRVSTNPLETKEDHKNQKNHMIFPYDFFCVFSMIFPIYDISEFFYDFYRIK